MVTEELPMDPALPQLRIAWNPDLMREVFRSTLRPLGKDSYHIQNCRISRFRYRQATRSIVLYELRLREAATGHERNIWVTGVTYPGDRARHLSNKLLSTNPERGIPEAWMPFEPVSFIPDLKMLVQIFPVDRYLPTLPMLIRGLPPKLEHLFLDQFGAGVWRIKQWHVEPARYRPFLGVTLRYTIDAREVESNHCKTRCFYVKVYRDDSGKQTYEMLRILQQRFSDGKEGFTTVKPIAYLNDLRALILEAAPGKSLEQVLLDDKDVEGAASKAARALAALHKSNIAVTRHRSREDMITRAKKAETFIQWACPNLSMKVKEIIRALETHLKEVPSCPTHLDIKADHIFFDDSRVIFMDMDSFGLGDPVFDPASLLARLEALPNISSISHSTVQTAARVFSEEYFANVPNSWRRRLPLNYTCAALNVAVYFVQHQEPNWRTVVTKIVNKAGDAVSGRAW